MLTILFLVTTLICAIGWLVKRISSLALIHYIQEKGYSLPTDAEIKESTEYVVKKMFRLR